MENYSVVNGKSQRAVLVLGAGRSGTSLTTRALQAVGVELGNDFKRPSRKNPSGFFEDRALLALSKRLRRTLGLRPDSLRLLDEEDWNRAEVTSLYDKFETVIHDRFSQAEVWGFKYARTMRLLPFWMTLFRKLQIEPAFLMPIRNPLSVARSRAKLDRGRGVQENSDLEWLVNVVPYFELIQAAPVVVVDYDCLISEPSAQLHRIVNGLQLNIEPSTEKAMNAFAHDFLRVGLRHSRFSVEQLIEDHRINPLVKKAYSLLHDLAQDEIKISDPVLWDQWAQIHSQVKELGPILARLDDLARELRSARWNPLSPFPAAVDELRKLKGKI